MDRPAPILAGYPDANELARRGYMAHLDAGERDAILLAEERAPIRS
ncbi:MAG TPA: hypothetical protein VHW09_03455 [Bryobacteraceae bacterium]|nr:hypothetical protein [Bryobacteraceae bacterium]